jgi:hypothetical protein
MIFLLLQLSVTSEIVVVNESNYRNLLTNARVSKIINENAQFSWWDSHRVVE